MYGLIGKKLSHSYSAILFGEKFGNEFGFELIEIDNIIDLTRYIDHHPELKGLSVTIPYKKEIIPYLSSIDPIAEECGAVNTVSIIKQKDKTLLHGYNTDVYGFSEAYKKFFPSENKNALVLGTGGAAVAVAYALRKTGMNVTFVSRMHKSEKIISFKELTKNLISENNLIVNTTPLGMFPKITDYPDICYSAIGPQHVVVDIIYNPETTLFMQKCMDQGAVAYNGLDMLKKQAEKAWEIWGLV
jgi:shikimate dehydrogenase